MCREADPVGEYDQRHLFFATMKLKEKADAAHSIHIRQQDCPDGHGYCISCGTPITFNTCDCGHFIPRAHMATRFYERNCAAQCVPCNRYKDGNLAGFTLGLVERYGDGIIEELNALKRTTVKLSKSDYKEIMKKYGRMD